MAADRRPHSETSAPTPGRAKASYREILIEEILEGLGELRRPVGGLLLSAFAAGLEIGFSVLLMAIPLTFADELPPMGVRLLVANFYAVGFLFVVMGRSELGSDLLRFLGWTALGNSIGGAVFVALIKYGHVVRSVDPEDKRNHERETRSWLSR